MTTRRHRKTRRRTGVIAFLALGAAACGAAPQATTVEVERTDSAGVEIVWNRGADLPLDWSFEPQFRIGGEDEGPESFFGLWSGSIRVGAEGNLYIFDTGNTRVVVFDSVGNHLRILGRQGGGPGEIQRASGGFAVEPDGTVNVFDFGKLGLVRFDAEGRPLDVRRVEAFPYGGRFEIVDGSILLQLSEFDATRDASDDLLALISESGDSTILARFSSPPMRPVTFSCGVSISGMAQVFAPTLVWAARAERLAINAGAAYVVDLYEADRRVASVRRDVALRPATSALARREVDDGMRIGLPTGECVVPADEVIEQRGLADVIPAVGEIAIAPDGTLWIKRRVVKGEAAPIDVIAPDGAYIGTLPPGTPFPSDFLPDGRIAVLEEDELEVQYVVVYRVRT